MKPIILIDMNLSPEWAETLLAAGWPAVHWSAIGPVDATDSEIMDWARSNGAVVFTHDLDFSTALALCAASRPSILQIRGQRVLPEQLGLLVISLLDRYLQDLIDGALLTVDEQKHRVRILPLS